MHLSGVGAHGARKSIDKLEGLRGMHYGLDDGVGFGRNKRSHLMPQMRHWLAPGIVKRKEIWEASQGWVRIATTDGETCASGLVCSLPLQPSGIASCAWQSAMVKVLDSSRARSAIVQAEGSTTPCLNSVTLKYDSKFEIWDYGANKLDVAHSTSLPDSVRLMSLLSPLCPGSSNIPVV